MRRATSLPMWAKRLVIWSYDLQLWLDAPFEWFRDMLGRRLTCPYEQGPMEKRGGTVSHFCLACGEPAGHHHRFGGVVNPPLPRTNRA